MEQHANEDMMRNALGDEYDEMALPPFTSGNMASPLWDMIVGNIREIYDPEIPVNIYELGLIYQINIEDETGKVDINMTLTAPGCPVAGEMPGWVEEAAKSVEGVNDVTVNLVWDPPWNPTLMAETAKYQLNMF